MQWERNGAPWRLSCRCGQPTSRRLPNVRCGRGPRYATDARTLLYIVANDIEIDPDHQLVAPNVIRSQALTLLLADVRSGNITEQVALQHHERFTELKMWLLGDRVSRRTA